VTAAARPGGTRGPSLGQRLRTQRETRGISQSQAARELEVARTAYRLWELEAAKPAPDRWRLVARWLGVSMTTLLLAEGLLSGDEAADMDAAADRFLVAIGETSDSAAEDESGGFFEQAQSFIDHGLERGLVSAEEARNFREVFRRIERGLSRGEPGTQGTAPGPVG
jgi:transcriptional regulator with XRE-family HTH domain